MAFTGNFMATSFKQQLLEAVHDFRAIGGDTFKLALYDNNASFTAATTAFTTDDEVGDSGSYVSGGGDLTRLNPTTSGTTAFTDFDDLSFTTATITARGALIYNSTPAHTYTNPVVAVLDFGSDKTSTNGTFTIQFPTPDASNAIIRIA
jgi:hypothetical protein